MVLILKKKSVFVILWFLSNDAIYRLFYHSVTGNGMDTVKGGDKIWDVN